MNAVDTNVLFYAHDQRDVSKREAAVKLISSIEDGALLWQVACEFLAAAKKLEPFGYDRQHAWQDIRSLRLVWSVVFPGWAVLERADDLVKRYSLSHWDALLIASCVESPVTRLYSEDFDAYGEIDGVEIVNPFRR